MKNRSGDRGEAVISSLGEFALISRLVGFGEAPVGPGDDCSVYPVSSLIGNEDATGYLLLTTDTCVSGRHFSFEFSTPYDVGWKSVAVSLSDIAAMGGMARGVLVNLSAPAVTPSALLEEIYRGMKALCDRAGMFIAGGDTVESNELQLSTTVFGYAGLPPVLRSGAEAGDDLWVSGAIGAAVAGLSLFKGALSESAVGAHAAELRARHLRPEPRLSLGKHLLEHGIARAMIDVSDGLLQDAGHLAARSGAALLIHAERIPLAAGLPCPGLTWFTASTGGDDYELLFSAPLSARSQLDALSRSKEEIPALTRIGSVASSSPESEGMVSVVDESGALVPVQELATREGRTLGFSHFK